MKKKSKSISLQERWQSDIESRDRMYRENPPEPFVPTKEQIEEYKEKYGIDLTKKPIIIDRTKDKI